MSSLPQHIAIIMDGNGRWAKERGISRNKGHQKGAKALKQLLLDSQDLGVKYLTVYAFSSENWGRPEEEVSSLMELLAEYLHREAALLFKHNIRFRMIGDRSRLSLPLRKKIGQLTSDTQLHDTLNFTIALSYGGRQEVISAIHRFVESGHDVSMLDENAFKQFLDTHDLPDPDLLIRTGGDHRISNFLLWQSAYTELYFEPCYWPDFTRKHLEAAIKDYKCRERRFGHV